MRCTCGSSAIGSNKHSGWCDSVRHITLVAKVDMENSNTRYLYVTEDSPVKTYEKLREDLKDSWLACMNFDGCCSIIFKNSSEIYFVAKENLGKDFLNNFDGSYADKCLENLNIAKHLKPLAPIKYVENYTIAN